MRPTSLAALAVVLLPAAAAAQQEPPTLRVQGAGEVRVAPDQATVLLGVLAEAPTAGAAQADASRRAGAALEALRGLGLDDRVVQTGRLTLNPVYTNPRPGGPATISGYRAANTLSIRIEAIDQVGDVIDAALRAGANELRGVSFGLADEAPFREEALRLAIAEARGKANAMAGALGVSLAGILSVNEDNVFVQRPAMELGRVMAMQAEPSTPVAPGEVTVSAGVSIAYRIE